MKWILDFFVLIRIGGFWWFNICVGSLLGLLSCFGCILIICLVFIVVSVGFVMIAFDCRALVTPCDVIISFLDNNGSVSASSVVFNVLRQSCMMALLVEA